MVMEFRYLVSNFKSADPFAAFAWLDHAVKFAEAMSLEDYQIYDTAVNSYLSPEQVKAHRPQKVKQ